MNDLEMLSEINWQLIMIIAVTSAVVSYVGDHLGKKIGKKRISLFGMRPRSTSTVITLLTGVAVALITLASASYTSGRVRHAFFGVNYLDRQISQLNIDLRDRQYKLDDMEMEVFSAREELDRLKAESEGLRRSLDEMKDGVVIAAGGELLAQTVIDGDINATKVERAITELIEAAEKKLKQADQHTEHTVSTEVTVSEEERAKIMDHSSSSPRKVLRLVAPSNIVLGQTVDGVVRIFDSRLIYTSGDLLIARSESETLSSSDSVDVVYALLRQINRRAVRDGVLPDPITGAVGILEGQEFYDAADRLASMPGDREIAFYAANDIYTEGPVNVRVEITEK